MEGHGMINSTWILHVFHMDSTGFHGMVHTDSMEPSIWIPCNKFNSMVIPLECQRNNLIWSPKIVTPSGIEHQAPGCSCDLSTEHSFYAGVKRHENKFKKSCNLLATCKSSISKPQCSICYHQQTNKPLIPTTTITHTNHCHLCHPPLPMPTTVASANHYCRITTVANRHHCPQPSTTAHNTHDTHGRLQQQCGSAMSPDGW